MQREAIIRGPAIVTHGGLTFYSKDDIKVVISHKTFDVESSMFGNAGPRVSGREARVSFTPAGQWQTGLWPYAAYAIGQSIYGSTDRDLVIQPFDTANQKWTFKNAAITKLPDINLSATKTLVGDVEFTALGVENGAPSVANSLVERSANASFGDTSFDPSQIKTQPYSAAWGATLTGIETRAGWSVKFNLGLQDVESDTYGVIDKIITDIGVTASMEPLTISEAEALTTLGIDKAMGASLVGSNDLVITGTNVSVTVKNAILRQLQPVFGRSSNRLGTLEFSATRTFAAGRPVALYAVA